MESCFVLCDLTFIDSFFSYWLVSNSVCKIMMTVLKFQSYYVSSSKLSMHLGAPSYLTKNISGDDLNI